jgi:hypothetical protein
VGLSGGGRGGCMRHYLMLNLYPEEITVYVCVRMYVNTGEDEN